MPKKLKNFLSVAGLAVPLRILRATTLNHTCSFSSRVTAHHNWFFGHLSIIKSSACVGVMLQICKKGGTKTSEMKTFHLIFTATNVI